MWTVYQQLNAHVGSLLGGLLAAIKAKEAIVANVNSIPAA
jgi:hypothetical protein